MLFGEAPGPRGADQSGIPFWGDRAGTCVYRALEAAGLARVPAGAFQDWDGARFRAEGLAPVLRGVALSNAFPVCPTRDFQTFRAPTDKELLAPDNLDRLRGELREAAGRCPGRLRVIAMGRRAQWVFARIDGAPDIHLDVLPHPSSQGLLQAAPGKGKGLKLEDLRREWEARLAALLET
ncbi:uracil-DNA glycosylase family protein [Mesoterricola silvestris]|nr:uracil-DNA glycosylase family protein [Mesoterricola silvestris]